MKSGIMFVDEAGDFVPEETQYFSCVLISEVAEKNLEKLELEKGRKVRGTDRNNVCNFFEKEDIRAIVTWIDTIHEPEI